MRNGTRQKRKIDRRSPPLKSRYARCRCIRFSLCDETNFSSMKLDMLRSTAAYTYRCNRLHELGFGYQWMSLSHDAMKGSFLEQYPRKGERRLLFCRLRRRGVILMARNVLQTGIANNHLGETLQLAPPRHIESLPSKRQSNSDIVVMMCQSTLRIK